MQDDSSSTSITKLSLSQEELERRRWLEAHSRPAPPSWKPDDDPVFAKWSHHQVPSPGIDSPVVPPELDKLFFDPVIKKDKNKRNHNRKRSPGHVPRPRNRFMQWRSFANDIEYFAAENNPAYVRRNFEQQSFVKVAAKMWKGLSLDDKVKLNLIDIADAKRLKGKAPKPLRLPQFLQRGDPRAKKEGEKDDAVGRGRIGNTAAVRAGKRKDRNDGTAQVNLLDDEGDRSSPSKKRRIWNVDEEHYEDSAPSPPSALPASRSGPSGKGFDSIPRRLAKFFETVRTALLKLDASSLHGFLMLVPTNTQIYRSLLSTIRSSAASSSFGPQPPEVYETMTKTGLLQSFLQGTFPRPRVFDPRLFHPSSTKTASEVHREFIFVNKHLMSVFKKTDSEKAKSSSKDLEQDTFKTFITLVVILHNLGHAVSSHYSGPGITAHVAPFPYHIKTQSVEDHKSPMVFFPEPGFLAEQMFFGGIIGVVWEHDLDQSVRKPSLWTNQIKSLFLHCRNGITYALDAPLLQAKLDREDFDVPFDVSSLPRLSLSNITLRTCASLNSDHLHLSIMGDNTDHIFRGKHSLPSSAYERYATFDDTDPVPRGPMPPPPVPLWTQEDVAPTMWAQAHSKTASTSQLPQHPYPQSSSSPSGSHTHVRPYPNLQTEPHQAQHTSTPHSLPQPGWPSTTAQTSSSGSCPPRNQNSRAPYVPEALPQTYAQPYPPGSTSYPIAQPLPQFDQFQPQPHPTADVDRPPEPQLYPPQPYPAPRPPPPPSPVNLPTDQETLDFLADQAHAVGSGTGLDGIYWTADLEDGGGEGYWDQYAGYDASMDQIQYYAIEPAGEEDYSEGDEEEEEEEEEEAERDTGVRGQPVGGLRVDAQGQAAMPAYTQSQGQNVIDSSYGTVAVADTNCPQTQASYADPAAPYAPAPATDTRGAPQTEYGFYMPQVLQEQYSAQIHLGVASASQDDDLVYAIDPGSSQYSTAGGSSSETACAHAPPESTNAHTGGGPYEALHHPPHYHHQQQQSQQLDPNANMHHVHSYQPGTAGSQASIGGVGGSYTAPQQQHYHYVEPTLNSVQAQTNHSTASTAVQMPAVAPGTFHGAPYEQPQRQGQQYHYAESKSTTAHAPMYQSTYPASQAPVNSTGAVYGAQYQQQNYANSNQGTNPGQVPGYDPVPPVPVYGTTATYEIQQQHLRNQSQDYQTTQSGPGDLTQAGAEYPSTSYAPYPVGVSVGAGSNPVAYAQTPVDTALFQGAQQDPSAGYGYKVVPPPTEQSRLPSSESTSGGWNGGYSA